VFPPFSGSNTCKESARGHNTFRLNVSPVGGGGTQAYDFDLGSDLAKEVENLDVYDLQPKHYT
jgi:hypothetical protein